MSKLFNRTLILIKPRADGLNYENISYARIREKAFDVRQLKLLLLQANVQDPNLIDLPQYIAYGYKGNDPIFINKEDGLLYGFNDDKKDRITAIRLLRILRKVGLVYSFKRFYLRKPRQEKLIVGWQD